MPKMAWSRLSTIRAIALWSGFSFIPSACSRNMKGIGESGRLSARPSVKRRPSLGKAIRRLISRPPCILLSSAVTSHSEAAQVSLLTRRQISGHFDQIADSSRKTELLRYWNQEMVPKISPRTSGIPARDQGSCRANFKIVEPGAPKSLRIVLYRQAVGAASRSKVGAQNPRMKRTIIRTSCVPAKSQNTKRTQLRHVNCRAYVFLLLQIKTSSERFALPIVPQRTLPTRAPTANAAGSVSASSNQCATGDLQAACFGRSSRSD